MQSGKAREGQWVLEFESSTPKRPDPLTGWAGGSDTQTQVRLVFDTQAAAETYAKRNDIDYHVLPPVVRTMKIQSYADNFR